MCSNKPEETDEIWKEPISAEQINPNWEYLDERRRACGLTIREWADISNVPESTIRHICQGVKNDNALCARADTVYRICAAVNASVDVFFGIAPSSDDHTKDGERIRTLEHLLSDKTNAIQKMQIQMDLLEGRSSGAASSIQRLNDLLAKEQSAHQAEKDSAMLVITGLRKRITMLTIIIGIQSIVALILAYHAR